MESAKGVIVMLTKRQQKILKAVIQSHIRTASPVSSKHIYEKYRIGVSPATIRNEMQYLEEMGYLYQPHTSSGRLPTEKGYKFYIENLMENKALSEDEKKIIIKEFSKKDVNIEEIVKNTASFLSSLADNIGIIIAPKLFNTPIVKIELILLSGGRILTILILQGGIAIDKILTIREKVTQEELNRVANKLNNIIYGKTLIEIRAYPLEDIITELIKFDRLIRRLKRMLEEFFKLAEEKIIYLEGFSNIASKPEFENTEYIKHILYLLDDKELLNSIIEEKNKEVTKRIKVIMGSEIGEDFLKGCSLVVTSYRFHGFDVGNIGVLGPLRMDYSKVVSVVDFISKTLTQYLNKTMQ